MKERVVGLPGHTIIAPELVGSDPTKGPQATVPPACMGLV